MKYKTFRKLFGAGATVAGVAAVVGLMRSNSCDSTTFNRNDDLARQIAERVKSQPPAAPGERPRPDAKALRGWDEEIVAALSTPLDGAKARLEFPDNAIVDVYCEDADRLPDRARVDINRDGEWDEKWTARTGADGRRLVERSASHWDNLNYRPFRLRLVGGWWVDPDAIEPAAPSPAPGATTSPSGWGADAHSASGPGALRPLDRAVLDRIGTIIAGDKVKDAVPGEAKVNLYRDPGHAAVNRVKIDLDRDDKWDEKWTAKTGEAGKRVIERQVSPGDDEEYSQVFLLEDGRWVDPAAPRSAQPSLEAAPDSPADSAPGALRPLDRAVLERVARNIQGDKAKDAIPGEAKVNLYRDAGEPGVNRLKIDLDRDEKWDEKWDFEREGDTTVVKRRVAPADDEQYSLEYRLHDGRWVRKQP